LPNDHPAVLRVIPTQAARADLVYIREYSFEQFGPDIADEYFLGFEAAFDRLAGFPLSGSAHAELGKDIRCLVHRRHRIFYTVQGDTVLIVRIVHHAMDVRQALMGAVG